MARCIERQLADPIPIPSAGASDAQKRCPTPRSNQPPFPKFSQKYFNLGNGNGPLACDSRIRNNHPISVCRNLVPQLDTPLSPPAVDRYPDFEVSATSNPCPEDSAPVDAISKHFRGMAVSEGTTMVGYSDCVVCGKSVEQLQSEAVTDYLNKTSLPEKTRKIAFLDGMSAGTFLLMPGGVSQATACDCNWYSIAYNL